MASGIPRDSKDDDLDLWPLEEIDPGRGKFPCCIGWSPLPVVSWLVPYIGHVAICREDGAVLDFSGSNLISVGSSSYGSVARYLQLDRNMVSYILSSLSLLVLLVVIIPANWHFASCWKKSYLP